MPEVRRSTLSTLVLEGSISHFVLFCSKKRPCSIFKGYTPLIYNDNFFWNATHIGKKHIGFNPFSEGIKVKRLNPLSPHDALKHHLHPWKHTLLSYNQGFKNGNILETALPIHRNFLQFLNHIKSYSSTTSRELRHQFAACSGWRWQWKIQAWKG